jgi:hypothetical protein
MKNLLMIFLGWVCTTSISAQTHTLRATVDQATTVEMTVRIENNIAYVHRSPVAFDATAQHGIADLAGVEIGDGTITIPDDGERYWIVPYDAQVEAFTPTFTYLCLKCYCMEGPGTCKIIQNGCYFETCNVCMLVLYPCTAVLVEKNQILLKGPFAILKASEIVIE